eukprot:gene15583-15730_t
MDAEKIRAGVGIAMAELAKVGHDAVQLYIPAAPAAALPVFAAALAQRPPAQCDREGQPRARDRADFAPR